MVGDLQSGSPPTIDLTGFTEALLAAGFTGDIETDLASRVVLATDNSIYQVLPLAALFPRVVADIDRIVQLVAGGRYGAISLTARGGGTGTNGQSLNDGVLVDTSRYLNAIIGFDPVAETVTVEPGVVLDQLNAYLAPLGYFFPPTVSTASRATLGGMVATDASGKGSRHYGRASDYIVAMDICLADGQNWRAEPLDAAALQAVIARDDGIGRLLAQVHEELVAAAPMAETVFPRMNRGLTGYNLRDAMLPDGGMNLCKLLSGSEGTLALTKRLVLRVKPKPAKSALVAVFYDSFRAALLDVPRLVSADPLAVEILDDKILRLAQTDPVWLQLAGLFGDLPDNLTAVNFVEFTGETDDELQSKAQPLLDMLATRVAGQGPHRLLLHDPTAIGAAWSLRQKAVGLLGALENDRPGIPFVEDTAVPPERLGDYVDEFRALLDGHGVDYGMFGHADVGCLHVRPTLNMLDPTDRALVRTISDGVVALTKSYGGLLWGEHGRGFRGEYSPTFFGPELYPVLRRLKAVFDPHNRLNPGKLAAPAGSDAVVTRIDQAPFRGVADAQIAPEQAATFGKAISCNGNGACHTWDANEAMCPSFKATRDKKQSPKGRAALLREWARERSLGHVSPAIGEALHQSLSTCLSCRACASQCPVKVDIPTMKSAFLDEYFATRPRTLRDHVVARMETLTLLARRAPRLANGMLHNRLGRAIAAGVFKLVDLPRFSSLQLSTGLRQLGVRPASAAAIARLSAADRERAVIIVPDSFTGVFDTPVVIAAAQLLQRLGFIVLASRIMPNGKALEVRGFKSRFDRANAAITRQRALLDRLGLPLISLEPAVTAMPSAGCRPYLALDEFLDRNLPASSGLAAARSMAPHQLFLHCTEKTAFPQTAQRWKAIFARFGVPLDVVATGCCGMSGLFGHEREQVGLSRAIFDLSWRDPLAAALSTPLATGFSCRCQIKRFGEEPAQHPAAALLAYLDT